VAVGTTGNVFSYEVIFSSLKLTHSCL
jgi:hypothetical protein